MVFNDGPKRHDCGCLTCRQMGLELDELKARVTKLNSAAAQPEEKNRG